MTVLAALSMLSLPCGVDVSSGLVDVVLGVSSTLRGLEALFRKCPHSLSRLS
jgi:hypothetical protein